MSVYLGIWSDRSDQISELPLTAMPFKRIQRDPDVCNNCFRRTHQRKERNYAVRLHEGEIWVDEVDNDNVPDEVRPYDSETDYLRLDPSARGTRVICACGFPDDEKLRPLPKDLFLAYGRNLFHRYLEAGIEINGEMLMHRLEGLKSDPDKQFADDRLYMKATEDVMELQAGIDRKVTAAGD